MNLLPNLQLLAGTANIEKQDSLPAAWMDVAFPSEEKLATYIADNDLENLPLNLAEFSVFLESRKALLRQRLERPGH